MEKKKCSDLNNSELKEYLLSVENEFNAKKAEIKILCDELAELETIYENIQSEMKIRTTIF